MDLKNVKIESGGTIVGEAVEIERFISTIWVRVLLILLWIAGFASFLIIVLYQISYIETEQIVLRLSYFALALWLFYLAIRFYYLVQIKHLKIDDITKVLDIITKGGEVNLFNYFSISFAKSFSCARNKSKGEVNARALIECMLKSTDMHFIFARIGFSQDSITQYLDSDKTDIDVKSVLVRALSIAASEKHHRIESGDVFVAFCEKSRAMASFLSDAHLEVSDVANIVYWHTHVIRRQNKYKRRLFDPDDLALSGGIGRDWAYGFTPLLKQFSYDLTMSMRQSAQSLEVIGHEREISQIEEVLTRQKGGNALLVGEAGVGKKTCVLGFAERVAMGRSKGELNRKHILELDIESLLSSSHGANEVTQRIVEIMSEASSAGNIILFIENIDNLFNSEAAGSINASEVLLPFLEASELGLIGTCDLAAYNRHIVGNSALSQRLTKIDIEEPNSEEMIRILEDVVPNIEYHTKSLITYAAIKRTIKNAGKYILNLPNPEKSINLLDAATARASSQRGATIITENDIDAYISEKYEIPAGEAGLDEKQKLLNLENIMHKRVIGQNEAISAISNALRRARAGVTESQKPIGSFLFLGTTGVGKTETAKALAEAYFGSEERMIRFDMSEYQNRPDIYRLIGSNLGSEEEPGVLTSSVQEHPFSLILFDELEKAHPDILNLFLQILDEGHLTDGMGRKVSFSNSIIIATSNAGSSLIKSAMSGGVEYEAIQKQLLDYVIDQGIYKTELINRFSGVIVFSPLDINQITEVAGLMTKKLAFDLEKNKGVKLEIAPEALKKLAEWGYDPVMGARPMARVIQEKVEDIIAKKILSSEIKKGDFLSINLDDLSG